MFGTFVISAIFVVCAAIVGIFLIYLFFCLLGRVLRPVMRMPRAVSAIFEEADMSKQTANMITDLFPESTSVNVRIKSKVKPSNQPSIFPTTVISQYEGLDYSQYDSPPLLDSERMDGIFDARTIRTLESDLNDPRVSNSFNEDAEVADLQNTSS